MNLPQHCGHYARVGLATFFHLRCRVGDAPERFPGHACVALVVGCGDVGRRCGH